MAKRRRRRVLFAAVSLLLILNGPMLMAGTPDAENPVPKDYATQWAKIISLSGVICAVAMIAYVLLFRRRHITSGATQWMLFIGICVMPLPVMVLSTAVGLEQAKDISFCQSCHVMTKFVNDMTNPDGKRLAALHFKNRYIQRDHCYVCHTDYGLFGTVRAKLAGLGHIWKETTGSYSLPVRIAQPYRFTICLDCHAQSAKYESVGEHRGLTVKALSGESECTACHGLSHAPRDERGV